jgi:hypothetical protein
MKIRKTVLFVWILAAAALAALAQNSAPAQEAPAQAPAGSATPYQPKFAGDPARSDSEAGALGFMRVVIRAQKEYYKKHNEYATTFADLVNHGSFTRRMAKTTERGDYTVGFKGKKDSYVLTMTPKNLNAEHRSFYAEDDSVIHGDETKAADEKSPKVK